MSNRIKSIDANLLMDSLNEDIITNQLMSKYSHPSCYVDREDILKMSYKEKLNLYTLLNYNHVNRVQALAPLPDEVADIYSYHLPDDEIKLSENEYSYIIDELYSDLLVDGKIVPRSDILVANTIPLKNLTITTTHNNNHAKANIIIFDDCIDKIEQFENENYNDFYSYQMKETKMQTKSLNNACGYIELTDISNQTKYIDPLPSFNNFPLIKPILAYVGDNVLRFSKEDMLYTRNHHDDNLNDSIFYQTYDSDELSEVLYHILSIWYVVQISMLHPVVKNIFSRNKKKIRNYVEHSSTNNDQRKVKYVKQHHITINEINSEIEKTAAKHHINRKTMIWYVTGHYRQYEDGRTVFIQPYWKGPLREIKSSKEQRDRDIGFSVILR